MDATCAWCGKDAAARVELEPGRNLPGGRAKLARTAPACAEHAHRFAQAGCEIHRGDAVMEYR